MKLYQEQLFQLSKHEIALTQDFKQLKTAITWQN